MRFFKYSNMIWLVRKHLSFNKLTDMFGHFLGGFLTRLPDYLEHNLTKFPILCIARGFWLANFLATNFLAQKDIHFVAHTIHGTDIYIYIYLPTFG